MKRLFRHIAAGLLMGCCAGIIAPLHAQVVELSEAQHALMKSQGTLPAQFSVHPNTPLAAAVVSPKPHHPPGQLKGGGLGCTLYIPPDASYTPAMLPNDDLSSAQIFLPFTFNLYGTNYTSLFINNNGNVSFGTAYGTFTASGFPSAGFVMIAPFWGDVDTRGPSCAGTPPAGDVMYYITPTSIYINWENVGYYGCQNDKLNTFQLILTDGTDPYIGVGNNAAFSYLDMQWTTGAASCFAAPPNDPCTDGTLWYSCSNSGGFGYGFCGSPAVVGANLGNGVDYIQIGTFDKPGMAYDGPFGLNDGVDWLDYKDFVFSTAISTQNISPIPAGSILCDTMVVCADVVTTFTLDFLAPEPGQTVVATSSLPTIASYTELSNVSGPTATIVSQMAPTAAEVGFHQITYTATDNGTPPATVTIFIDIEVLPPAATLPPASTTLCSTDPPQDLFSLFTGSPTPGGDWIDPLGNPHSGSMDPASDPAGAYVYSIGTGSMCPTTGIVTVAVIIAPDAGIDGALSTCTSNTPSDLFPLLGGTPDAGGAWSDPGGNAFLNPLDPAVAQAGDYTYTVLGTAPCAADQSLVVVAIALAVDAGQDASAPLCADAPPLDMLASLGGTPDATGNWFAPGGSPFSGTFNASIDAPGVYLYVTPAIAPCEPDSSALTITVDPLPDAGVDGVLVLCADDPDAALFALLGGTPDMGGIWIDPNNALHSDVLDPSTELSGDYIYVAYGVGECSALTDSSIIAAQLDHMPEVAFSATPLAGCNALEVEFSNDTPPAQTGTAIWDFGDATGGNDPGVFLHSYADPGTYDVTLTVTSPEGCVVAITQPDMIHVTPAPLATFTTYPNPTSVESPTVLFNATDPQAVQWEWIIADLDTLYEQEVGFDFPNVLGDTYEVCLTVTDVWGCQDTQCQDVVVKDPLLVFVPNTFTPNGDGVNDYFHPEVVGSDPEAYHLYVYDRWGGKVFESSDIHNIWIGTYMNRGSELLPTGTYAWRLLTRLDGGSSKEFMGHVTLLK